LAQLNYLMICLIIFDYFDKRCGNKTTLNFA